MSPSKMIGSQIGTYIIKEFIGEGGIGIVYKAYDTKLERVVAIKFLRRQLSQDRAFMQLLEKEPNLMAAVDHPNILHVYDKDVTSEGIPYFVMEYVDGVDLKFRLENLQEKGKKFLVKEAVDIAIKVCKGLEHAWKERTIVHRDIKPGNILIGKEGLVKITDFGLARSLERASISTHSKFMFQGTPHYASPEHVASGGDKEICVTKTDHRSDVYSLGILLYELLTNKVPFDGVNPIDVMYKHVHEAPIPPWEVDSRISRSLGKIILKAIEKKTEKRFQGMTEMKKTLEVYYRDSFIEPRTDLDDFWERKKKKWKEINENTKKVLSNALTWVSGNIKTTNFFISNKLPEKFPDIFKERNYVLYIALFSLLVIACVRIIIPPPIEPVYDQRLAIIVGIDDYEDRPLIHAVNDARKIKTRLDCLGFKTKVFLNDQATKQNIMGFLQKELPEQMSTSGNDCFFLYFTGRGYTKILENGDNKGFIIPVDGDLARPDTYISFDELCNLSDVNVNHIFYALDAFFSDEIIKHASEYREDEFGEDSVPIDNLKKTSKKKVFQILTAGIANENISGGHRDYRLSQSLINALSGEANKDNDNFITSLEIKDYVMSQFKNQTQTDQIPLFVERYANGGQVVFELPTAAQAFKRAKENMESAQDIEITNRIFNYFIRKYGTEKVYRATLNEVRKTNKIIGEIKRISTNDKADEIAKTSEEFILKCPDINSKVRIRAELDAMPERVKKISDLKAKIRSADCPYKLENIRKDVDKFGEIYVEYGDNNSDLQKEWDTANRDLQDKFQEKINRAKKDLATIQKEQPKTGNNKLKLENVKQGFIGRPTNKCFEALWETHLGDIERSILAVFKSADKELLVSATIKMKEADTVEIVTAIYTNFKEENPNKEFLTRLNSLKIRRINEINSLGRLKKAKTEVENVETFDEMSEIHAKYVDSLLIEDKNKLEDYVSKAQNSLEIRKWIERRCKNVTTVGELDKIIKELPGLDLGDNPYLDNFIKRMKGKIEKRRIGKNCDKIFQGVEKEVDGTNSYHALVQVQKQYERILDDSKCTKLKTEFDLLVKAQKEKISKEEFEEIKKKIHGAGNICELNNTKGRIKVFAQNFQESGDSLVLESELKTKKDVLEKKYHLKLEEIQVVISKLLTIRNVNDLAEKYKSQYPCNPYMSQFESFVGKRTAAINADTLLYARKLTALSREIARCTSMDQLRQIKERFNNLNDRNKHISLDSRKSKDINKEIAIKEKEIKCKNYIKSLENDIIEANDLNSLVEIEKEYLKEVAKCAQYKDKNDISDLIGKKYATLLEVVVNDTTLCVIEKTGDWLKSFKTKYPGYKKRYRRLNGDFKGKKRDLKRADKTRLKNTKSVIDKKWDMEEISIIERKFDAEDKELCSYFSKELKKYAESKKNAITKANITYEYIVNLISKEKEIDKLLDTEGKIRRFKRDYPGNPLSVTLDDELKIKHNELMQLKK